MPTLNLNIQARMVYVNCNFLNSSATRVKIFYADSMDASLLQYDFRHRSVCYIVQLSKLVADAQLIRNE